MNVVQRQERCGSSMQFAELREPFRDALLIMMCASVLGVAVNLVRPEGIPFIAREEYRILVPCPEPGGAVTEMAADDPLLTAPQTFLVDARPRSQHLLWSLAGAMNVPYDYLDPTPEEVIEELADRIASSRAQRVAIYGDGDTPDTGEQLAKEISAAGIKNVFFIRGGAPAIERSRSAGGGR